MELTVQVDALIIKAVQYHLDNARLHLAAGDLNQTAWCLELASVINRATGDESRGWN